MNSSVFKFSTMSGEHLNVFEVLSIEDNILNILGFRFKKWFFIEIRPHRDRSVQMCKRTRIVYSDTISRECFIKIVLYPSSSVNKKKPQLNITFLWI